MNKVVAAISVLIIAMMDGCLSLSEYVNMTTSK